MTPQIIEKLESVRETGAGRWIARCPAHDDRHPSLSVRELPDGRTLLHCFASCPVSDVLAAVGLEMRDLFPPTDPSGVPHYKPQRRAFNALDALRCLAFEARIAALAAADVAAGKTLDESDSARLFLAANRLQDGLAAVEGLNNE